MDKARKRWIVRLRKQLEEIRREHVQQVHALRDALAQDGAYAVGDSYDAAQTTEDMELFAALANTAHDTKSAIDAALDRMHLGTYGSCAECDHDIPLLRLKAYPLALRCRTCQEADESLNDYSEPLRL